MPLFSAIQWLSDGSHTAGKSAETTPPSISCGGPARPSRPPQVRFPISLPRPALRGLRGGSCRFWGRVCLWRDISPRTTSIEVHAQFDCRDHRADRRRMGVCHERFLLVRIDHSSGAGPVVHVMAVQGELYSLALKVGLCTDFAFLLGLAIGIALKRWRRRRTAT